ncbi:MAG TPA: iron dicitrate transport regulator FecR, partial [Leptospiraceae bacterium]|nr:iron dicitrate transport regulator FecR [Leptospiraceae bacterium]
MRFFRKREIFITVLLLLSTFIFSFLFYRNLNSSGSFSDEKEIGTISFKINSIQRKHNAQLIWRNLEQHSPLRNKDII